MATYNHQLDVWYQWRLGRTEGDYLRTCRLSYVDYENPVDDPASCRVDRHIVGAYESRFGREGNGARNRYNRLYQWDCNGKVTELRAVQGFASNSSERADGNWENWVPAPPPAASATDLVSSYSYLSNGNLERLDFSGGDNYPDGSASNSYAASFTWQYGSAASMKFWHDQTTPFDYFSQDVTPDGGGFIVSSRDPNGLEAT